MLRLSNSPDGRLLAAYVGEALAEASMRLIQDEDPARVRLYQGESRTLLAMKQYLNPVS